MEFRDDGCYRSHCGVGWGGWPKHSSPEREDEIRGERGRLGSKKWTLLCGSDLDLHREGVMVKEGVNMDLSVFW